MDMYQFESQIRHQVDILARETGVVGMRQSLIVWEPRETGLEFQPLPDAPPPADTEQRRLLQLRRLSTRFQATLVSLHQNVNDREVLRLLPQPIYRYGREGSECLDGGLFAFVTGTDPEAVLMIEASRTTEEKYEWQYAFVRRSSGQLEARLDNDVVWQVNIWPPDSNDPRNAHLTLRTPLPPELGQP
jgi:hypothetical protein